MMMKVMMKVNYDVIAVNITASKCLACMKRCWDPELEPNSIEEIKPRGMQSKFFIYTQTDILYPTYTVCVTNFGVTLQLVHAQLTMCGKGEHVGE